MRKYKSLLSLLSKITKLGVRYLTNEEGYDLESNLLIPSLYQKLSLALAKTLALTKTLLTVTDDDGRPNPLHTTGEGGGEAAATANWTAPLTRNSGNLSESHFSQYFTRRVFELLSTKRNTVNGMTSHIRLTGGGGG